MWDASPEIVNDDYIHFHTFLRQRIRTVYRSECIQR